MSVRKLTSLSVLGAVLCGGLGGCADGSPEAAPPAAHAPSPAHSPTPASAPASPAAPRTPPPAPEPPVLAPGPGGLTPVLKRGTGRTDKVVALTFDADMTADEGPRAAAGERFDNPELIALLRRLKVPATVFMTGRWAEEYPGQARSIGTDPLFEIANHSYSHHAFTTPCYGLPAVDADPAAMRGEVERAFGAIRRTGARRVVPYFRFPGGCYDRAALRAIGPEKVTAVQWDVVSGDAFATDADAVADQVLDGVEPGSLVVMHCTRSAAPATARAVRRIVPELRARGYRFVRVSQLIAGR